MIQEFVDRFDVAKDEIRKEFVANRPRRYQDLVTTVVKHIAGTDYCRMDHTNIHCIDDGEYQGTLVFVIPEDGYQPSHYWYVKVAYGSCSGCDTLASIHTYDDVVNEEEANGYMTLALHIVQGLKEM